MQPTLAPPARKPAQWDHDANLEHLTTQRLHATLDFIRACEKMGVWRLRQGEFSDDSGFFAAELAVALAKALAVLVENGDVVLARRLPGICLILQSAG